MNKVSEKVFEIPLLLVHSQFCICVIHLVIQNTHKKLYPYRTFSNGSLKTDDQCYLTSMNLRITVLYGLQM